ncbi:UNVERIFIED_CONTAM: hypothetical protein Sradi_1331100 [Sesamum radiatum]|uniref:Uncharacterized protein n=1 Tax=Sesamum radiatum TaxID=300843 RepID=A0AAW2UT18_SESRA
MEEKSGPLLSIDASGNILNFDEHVPLLQYSVGDAGDEEGIGAQNEGVGIEEGVENEAAGVEEGAEGENESVGVENEGAGTEAVEGEEVGDVTGVFWGDYVDWGEVQGEFQTEGQTGVDVEVQTGVEGDVGMGLRMKCKMMKDLEGPWDDDIFTNRPENYTRTMLKTLRSLMRERRKKRKQEQQNKKGEGSSRGNEQWFSDCEDEELKSVRGSDDEGDGCPVWDERMNVGKVDLAVGMKFETRAKFRDMMRDWAVRRG